jgi:predicted O-methyltransferase YrrM
LQAAKDWDKPIAVLFIDADHEMAGVDFGAWEKYLIPGAIVLFHDYAVHSPNVISDCKGIIRDDSYCKVIYAPPLESRIDTSIFIIQKK